MKKIYLIFARDKGKMRVQKSALVSNLVWSTGLVKLGYM